eukprot:3453856-Amphidinium_carterae.1
MPMSKRVVMPPDISSALTTVTSGAIRCCTLKLDSLTRVVVSSLFYMCHRCRTVWLSLVEDCPTTRMPLASRFPVQNSKSAFSAAHEVGTGPFNRRIAHVGHKVDCIWPLFVTISTAAANDDDDETKEQHNQDGG